MRHANSALVAIAAAWTFAHASTVVDGFLVAIAVQAWIAARNAWLDDEVVSLTGIVLTIGTWAGFAWVAATR